MEHNRKATFIILAGFFAALAYGHGVVRELSESPFNDFGHYWMNACLLRDGFNAWSREDRVEARRLALKERDDLAFQDVPLHSPGYFLFVVPFTAFDFRRASFLWLASGHLLLFCSIWLLLRLRKRKISLEDLCMAVFLVFSFWPLREQVHDGQPNFLILFFISLSFFFLSRSKMLLAGLFLGILFQVREYLALLALFFIVKKDWKALAGIAIGFLALKITAISVFGWDNELSYWRYIFSLFATRPHLTLANHSLAAAVYRVGRVYLGTAACAAFAIACILFLAAKAVSWVKGAGKDALLSFCVFLTLCFIVSPWVHESHYVALYPAILISWFGLEREESARCSRLFILSYLFLGLGYSLVRFPYFYRGLPAVFTAGKLAGVLILFFLTGILTRRSMAWQQLPSP